MDLIADDDKSKSCNYPLTVQAGDNFPAQSDRYNFLHKQFDDYRQKMNRAMKAKDKHITALQNRINLLVNENGKDDDDCGVHALMAQRDRLQVTLDLLEKGFSQEQQKWKDENAKLKDEIEILQKQQQDISAYAQMTEITNKLSLQDNYLLEIERKLQTALKENSRLSTSITDINLQLEQTKASLDEATEKLVQTIGKNDVSVCDRQLSPIFERDENNGLDGDQNNELLLENFRLKQEMTDIKDYYETADVESEEKISMLANRLEELEEIIEEKNRECTLLNKNLTEAVARCSKAEEKANSFERNFFRQKDLIENLKEEIENMKDSMRDSTKEKDDLLIKNASLNHELNHQRKKARGERDLILHQLNMAGEELQDCMNNLKSIELEIAGQHQKGRALEPNLDNGRLRNRNAAFSKSWNSLNFHSSIANLAAKIDALERDMHTKEANPKSMTDKPFGKEDDFIKKNCSLSDYAE